MTTKPAPKSAPHSQQTSKPSAKVEKQTNHASRVREEASLAESGSDLKSQQPARTTKKAPGKPTSLTREQSDLFKAFSKPKAKLHREDTGSSVGDSPAPSVVAQSVRVHVSAGVDSVLIVSSPESQVYLRMVCTTKDPTFETMLTCAEPMKDASEDEQEADFIDSTAAEAKSNRNSKAEREEQLRKMMEQEGMYLF